MRGRAAEINRAYRELRGSRNLKDPLELNEEWRRAGERRSRGWPALHSLAMAVAAALALACMGPLGPFGGRLALARCCASRRRQTRRAADPMDQPLHVTAISASAQRAAYLARTRDEMALASASRDCHHALRSDPSLLQLDRCAAFDDAVVQLQDRDPLARPGTVQRACGDRPVVERSDALCRTIMWRSTAGSTASGWRSKSR